MKRPVIWFSLSFLAGIYCCRYAAKQLVFCGIFIALISLGLFLLKKSPSFFLIFVFFLGGGLNWLHWQSVRLEQPMAFHEKNVSFEGRISDLPKEGKDGFYSYRVNLSSLNGEKSRLNLWLTTMERLEPGERISASGKVLSSLALQRQGDGFGSYLVRQNYSLSCMNPEITPLPATGWDRLLNVPLTLRSQAEQALTGISSPWRGILTAIFTGDKSGLSSVQRDMFAATGTSHVISVSGLHVSTLLMMALALFSFLRIPYPLDRICCLPLPILLAMMMGGQPPVLRASIMGFLFLLAECVCAEADSMNSLFLSALLILFFRPNQLFQADFLLSFSSTFGILAFSPILQRLAQKRIRSQELCSLLAVSVSSYLNALMVTLYFFHQFPLAALFSNLLLIPFFPFLLIGVVVYVWGVSLFPALAAPGSILLEGFTAFLFRPLEWLAYIPTLSLASPNRYLIAAYCLLIVFLYFVSRRYKGGVILLCCAVCLGAGCGQQYRLTRYDSVTAVSAGCIDNLVLRGAGGGTLLIAGVSEQAGSFSYDYKALLNYFRKNNIQTIDVFCFMNYNKDTAALFRALGQDRTIQAALLPEDVPLREELRRIATQNHTEAVDFSQPYSIALSETCRCTADPEGIFMLYEEERAALELSRQPISDAPLSKRPGKKELAVYGQSCSEKSYGTMQFLIKDGQVCRMIAENPYE